MSSRTFEFAEFLEAVVSAYHQGFEAGLGRVRVSGAPEELSLKEGGYEDLLSQIRGADPERAERVSSDPSRLIFTRRDLWPHDADPTVCSASGPNGWTCLLARGHGSPVHAAPLAFLADGKPAIWPVEEPDGQR